MPPPFPLEIWQHTIKELHDTGSYSTLSTLACTSRSLTNESQRTPAHLGPKVKDLVVRLPLKQFPKQKWISKDRQRQFALLLSHVPSLLSFSLQVYRGVDWNNFYISPQVGITQALSAVFRLSSIESVSVFLSIETVASARVLLQILNDCPSLQHLKLYGELPRVEFPFISDSTKLRKLKTLSILGAYIPALDQQYFTSGIENPNPHVHLESLRLIDANRPNSEIGRLAFLAKELPFPINHLKTLSLSLCNPDDAQDICHRLLLPCADTLEDVEISLFCDLTVPLSNTLPPVPFPRLRTISTQAPSNIHQGHERILEALPYLWGAASDLPNLTHIRVSASQGEYREETDQEIWDLYSGKIDWNASVNAISKWPSAIPSLLEVNVVVQAYLDEDVRKVDNVVHLLRTLVGKMVTGVEVNVRGDEMSGQAKYGASLQ
ncbi:hypothetical protein DL96DRAFT_1618015 [Flagelloscypha sp. PMI_526]|nr:hypothetical protein DL96DRAFT_1618015 [Flagelloscypha sp. PMI_526]